MKALLLLLFIFLWLLAAAAAAAVSCTAVHQAEAKDAGDTIVVAQPGLSAAGTCECAFLSNPMNDITCCTDETWTPAALSGDTCQCTFTAHQHIPAGTFDFYACSVLLG